MTGRVVAIDYNESDRAGIVEFLEFLADEDAADDE